MPETPDFIFATIGGGGLAAGVATYVASVSPRTRIIGAEPEGAASMTEALKQGGVVKLPSIEKFVDGAAVAQVGEMTFDICKEKSRTSSLFLRVKNVQPFWSSTIAMRL